MLPEYLLLDQSNAKLKCEKKCPNFNTNLNEIHVFVDEK